MRLKAKNAISKFSSETINEESCYIQRETSIIKFHNYYIFFQYKFSYEKNKLYQINMRKLFIIVKLKLKDQMLKIKNVNSLHSLL